MLCYGMARALTGKSLSYHTYHDHIISKYEARRTRMPEDWCHKFVIYDIEVGTTEGRMVA